MTSSYMFVIFTVFSHLSTTLLPHFILVSSSLLISVCLIPHPQSLGRLIFCTHYFTSYSSEIVPSVSSLFANSLSFSFLIHKDTCLIPHHCTINIYSITPGPHITHLPDFNALNERRIWCDLCCWWRRRGICYSNR